jgi:hypothetical protein
MRQATGDKLKIVDRILCMRIRQMLSTGAKLKRNVQLANLVFVRVRRCRKRIPIAMFFWVIVEVPLKNAAFDLWPKQKLFNLLKDFSFREYSSESCDL